MLAIFRPEPAVRHVGAERLAELRSEGRSMTREEAERITRKFYRGSASVHGSSQSQDPPTAEFPEAIS